MITRNVDSFSGNYSKPAGDSNLPLADAYHLSQLAPACPSLSSLVTNALSDEVGNETVVQGVNVSADSFYSSQGRIDDNFDDCNDQLIADYVLERYPEAGSMEMESFSLLHLAHCSRKPIFATACAIVVANRCTADVIPGAVLERMEDRGGLAMLQALASYQF